MKIVFFPISCTPFHGKTLEEKPLSGVETAVVRLSAALDALGHEVTVLTSFRKFPSTKPRYVNIEEAALSLEPADLLIGVRNWEVFFKPPKAKKRLLWTGDSYTNLHTSGIGDLRVQRLFDYLLCVSEWQANTLCYHSGFPRRRAHILHNGVDLAEFSGRELRKRKRLIYTSNPQRGLVHLPLIFIRLKQKHPDLELHIFSNAALYDMSWPPIVSADLPHQALLNVLAKLPDCYVHGTVLQSQLAREYMKSAILAYPCIIPETSCIACIEAQAAGCVVVTSALGALEETVGDAGILIREEPGSEAYIEKYIEALDNLLTDDNAFNTLSQKALEKSAHNDWKIRAQELIQFAHEKLEL